MLQEVSRSSGIIPVHNKRLVSQAQWLYEDLKNEYCKKILDKLIDNETHFLFDKNNIANIWNSYWQDLPIPILIKYEVPTNLPF